MNKTQKITLLSTLYLSQGLPFGFFTQALPVFLREAGSSLTVIGLTSLLATPWACKFLWAPLVDSHDWQHGWLRRWAPRGRRRSWILPLQLAVAGMFALLSLIDTAQHFTWLLAGVLFVNLLTATQDIATDALAVDMLRPEERGIGNGVQVAAYRVGMIIGGGLLLLVFDLAGWTVTFVAAALLLAVATLPIAMHREPDLQPRDSAAKTANALGRSLPRALLDAVRRPGMAVWLGVVVIYKAGEAFATAMLRPLLVDLKLGLDQIGLLLGVAGFIAGLLGALAGGWAITRLGRYRALVAFGLIQAMAVALYLVPAAGVSSLAILYLVCAVEHFASGMATAALFTIMMDRSRSEAAATDYAVQMSVVAMATGGAATVSGISAEAVGYTVHFIAAMTICLAGTAGAAWLARSMARAQHGAPDQRSISSTP